LDAVLGAQDFGPGASGLRLSTVSGANCVAGKSTLVVLQLALLDECARRDYAETSPTTTTQVVQAECLHTHLLPGDLFPTGTPDRARSLFLSRSQALPTRRKASKPMASRQT
jgi:hypothetical protein